MGYRIHKKQPIKKICPCCGVYFFTNKADKVYCSCECADSNKRMKDEK